MIARLEANPDLAARVASGVSQGLKGKLLGQWLAEGGFTNFKGAIFDGATLSRFKAASELLTGR